MLFYPRTTRGGRSTRLRLARSNTPPLRAARAHVVHNTTRSRDTPCTLSSFSRLLSSSKRNAVSQRATASPKKKQKRGRDMPKLTGSTTCLRAREGASGANVATALQAASRTLAEQSRTARLFLRRDTGHRRRGGRVIGAN